MTRGVPYVPSKRPPGPFDLREREVIYPAIARGIEDMKNDLAIAREVGVSERTVLRYRQRRGIPNVYER